MLSLARPALLAQHAHYSTASARRSSSARPAVVAAAPRSSGRIARRSLATTAAMNKSSSSDVECSSSSPSHAESFVFKASLAALAAAPPNLLFALASHADEAAAVEAAGTGGFKVTPLEILIVLAPVAFYALLTAYRSLVNPKASIGDGLFIVAALVIVANIVSILAFHKRIY